MDQIRTVYKNRLKNISIQEQKFLCFILFQQSHSVIEIFPYFKPESTNCPIIKNILMINWLINLLSTPLILLKAKSQKAPSLHRVCHWMIKAIYSLHAWKHTKRGFTKSQQVTISYTDVFFTQSTLIYNSLNLERVRIRILFISTDFYQHNAKNEIIFLCDFNAFLSKLCCCRFSSFNLW